MPQSREEKIPAGHLVRLVNEAIEALDLEILLAQYEGGGTSSYHPKIMLKVPVYAYCKIDEITENAARYGKRNDPSRGCVKTIARDEMSEMINSRKTVFPQKGEGDMKKTKRKKSAVDKEREAGNLARRLAEHGIYAMYAGKKGHGFWLYRVGVKNAKRMAENFDPEIFWDIADAFEETPVVKNDGRNGRNPFFWMFNDAMKLAEVPVTQ